SFTLGSLLALRQIVIVRSNRRALPAGRGTNHAHGGWLQDRKPSTSYPVVVGSALLEPASGCGGGVWCFPAPGPSQVRIWCDVRRAAGRSSFQGPLDPGGILRSCSLRLAKRCS